MSPQFATFASWKEVFGKAPTMDELLQEVRALNQESTTILLARLNVQLALDRFHGDRDYTIALQRFLLANLVDDETRERLRERYASESGIFRFAFHPLQVLSLLKLALSEGSVAGGVRPDQDKGATYKLGRCLLMVNDLLASDDTARALRTQRKSWRKKLVAMQLSLGPGYEITNPPDILSSLVRADIIFREIASHTATRFDIPGAFHKETGIDLPAYADMIFGTLAHYLTVSKDELAHESPRYLISLKTFFGKATGDAAQRFWNMEACSPGTLRDELQKTTQLKFHHNFVPLRMKPILKLNEDYAVCLSPQFVQEKLESGLFWSILNSLQTKEQRAELFTAWGRLFEAYVNYIMNRAVAAENERFVESPRFEDNGEEAFDGLVVSNNRWIAIEYKGGFLKISAKYAEDESNFVADLNLKFGAGVEQLVRKIGALFSAKEKERRRIKGVDAGVVKVVTPVLIVQDSFASSEITGAYLCEVFRSQMRKHALRKDVVWQGLVVIDIAELENVKRYTRAGKMTLTDCIAGRAARGDVVLSFRDFLGEYMEQRGIAPMFDEEMNQRYDEIMERVSQRFFGKSHRRQGASA